MTSPEKKVQEQKKSEHPEAPVREERAAAKDEAPELDFAKLDLRVEVVEERISPSETNVFDK